MVILFYSVFFLIPYSSGPSGIRWYSSVIPSLGLVPLVLWILLVVSCMIGQKRMGFGLNMTLWVSLGTFALAVLASVFWFVRMVEQGQPVNNQGTALFASGDVMDGAIQAGASGLVLGAVISIAAPSLAALLVHPYLFIENRLLRRQPSSITVRPSGGRFEGSFSSGFTTLFRRSLFFGLTFAIIYSRVGLPVVNVQPSGEPTLMSAFVGLFFYAAIIPAVVHFLEVNDYVISGDGKCKALFSEILMKWFGIGTSLSALITLLTYLPYLYPFIEKPIYVLFALITIAPGFYAILGSCVAIEILLTPKSRVFKIGLLALLPVLMWRTQLFDMLFLRHPTQPIVDYAIAFGQFTGGCFLWGYFVYPLPLVAAVLLLWITRKHFLKLGLARLILSVCLGVVLTLVVPFLLLWDNPHYRWTLWMPVISIIDLVVLALALPTRQRSAIIESRKCLTPPAS